MELKTCFRLNFKMIEIENHVFLHGPYPFYLFWSPKKVKRLVN